MDRYKSLASNTLIFALGSFGSKLLIFFMMPFYTWRLGTEGYGAVANITNASMFIMGIVTLSISDAVIRFGVDKKYDNSQVFSIGITTALTGLLVFLPFVSLLGMVEFISRYSILIYMYVFTGSIKSICALSVRSMGHVRLFAVDGIFTTVANICLNLLFLLVFDMGVTGYVLSVVLADLLSIIFLFYFGKLTAYFRLFGLDKHLRWVMYRFSIPMIPTTVMWWVTNVSDSFFITSMLGLDHAGIYNAAYKLPNMIALIAGIFAPAWNMSAITEKNSRTIAKFYTDVFNFYQSILYVAAAAMLLFIRQLLDIMTVGEGFNEAYRHSPMLILAVVLTCFCTFMGSVYIASKKSVRSMLTVMSGAAANLILNFLFIPMMGINGAALSTLISYIIVFTVRVIDTRSLVYMDLHLVKMSANFIILGLMGAVVMLVESTNFYYVSLAVLFLIVVVLNYRAGITALQFVIRKKKHD